MKRTTKQDLKRLLGGLPLTAELDWYLRRRSRPQGGFHLDKLAGALEAWKAQAAASPFRAGEGRKVLVFATLHYWIRHASLVGLALAGLGERVTLAYLPYYNGYEPLSAFNLRQHNLYAGDILRRAAPLLEVVSLLDGGGARRLPPELAGAVEQVSLRDAQYHLQTEEVDREGELFQLRLERNTAAAQAALRQMRAQRPDVILIPNGMILEFGALYQTARHLGISAVTYEFGEQRDRIWLAQNAQVMLQETDELWAARKDLPFTPEQYEQIKTLFAARRGADLWQNFSRRWQNLPAEGEAQVRARLGLDDRPVVLLAANVIGDSLTLGRQVFTDSMTAWLKRTLEYFAERDQAQFLLRVHPGEQGLKGPSVADLVARLLPQLPAHMRLIAADDPINTYDLVALADLGLVYTTTVGMEMAMSGVPAVVVGKTHYRGKGFTLDPASWEEFLSILETCLQSPGELRPSREQVDRAWHYAYRFFFDYPRPFPWHLLGFWDAIEEWPLSRVLTEEGQERYGQTFRYLAGEPIDWARPE